ncbi:MAG: ribonuclease P protein component [Gammaproteobacteria bacterium]|nr:MAG: ribonuclease P protein component [Gammaproteobacteria bacterium]
MGKFLPPQAAPAPAAWKPGSTFPKSARLLHPIDFKWVFAKHKRYADSLFTILAKEKVDPTPRLGLAVGKKAVKGAANRNRLKRIIRECFRNHQKDLAGLDMVILCTPQAKEASNTLLRGSLLKLWEGMIRERQ